MPDLLTSDDYDQLFRGFRHSARRLESRDRYAGDKDPFQRWLAGDVKEPERSGRRAAWLDRVEAVTAAGGRYERVRIVTEPLTDYQRFALRSCRQNVESGEDIRYLERTSANGLDLPAHDFWLFDGERIALMYFSADDRLIGTQLMIEPHVVRQHLRWFQLAFANATPYSRYVSDDPTRQLPMTGRT